MVDRKAAIKVIQNWHAAIAHKKTKNKFSWGKKGGGGREIMNNGGV